MEHLKEDVNNHFVNVTANQLQAIHHQSPSKMAVSTEVHHSSHQFKLSKYIEELIDKSQPAEVSIIIILAVCNYCISFL